MFQKSSKMVVCVCVCVPSPYYPAITMAWVGFQLNHLEFVSECALDGKWLEPSTPELVEIWQAIGMH